MVYLSEQSISKLKKAELVKYCVELTEYSKKHAVTPEYELVHNPKPKASIDSKNIGSEISLKVKLIDNDDAEKVYTITVKIMSDTNIQLSAHNMRDVINVDAALATLINTKGLIKSVGAYIIMQHINLGNKFCFIFD